MSDRFPIEVVARHRRLLAMLLAGALASFGITYNVFAEGRPRPNAGIPSAGLALLVDPTPRALTPYTVQPGDSLTVVARRFGVTVEALASANGIAPTGYLYMGQQLTIPAAPQGSVPTPVMTPQQPTVMVVSDPRIPTPTGTPKPPPPTVPSTPTHTPVVLTTPQGVTMFQYTVRPGDSLSIIAARFNTTVAALKEANNLANVNAITSGQVLMIVGGTGSNTSPFEPTPTHTPTPTPTSVPTPETPMGKLGPKWIELDLSTQMLVAYEGTTPVYSARMSSGRARFPTVTGTYRIYLKYRTQRMRGLQGTSEAYDIPNVPHVMYFFEGYGIHGVWWHNNFGTPASHGCINLSQADAKWMWEWAPMGTIVVSKR
jgi:LysM repeat protein